MRAAVTMPSEPGVPGAQAIIAAHVPSGPRRAALVDLKICDADGAPFAEAAQDLVDYQAKVDFVRVQRGVDADAAARYAGWAADRADDLRAQAARALEDLEDEFGEEDDAEWS